ncbi:hypothetical protein [Nitrososphaera sp.]
MQGIQKSKCAMCGTTFMAENGAKMCPSCTSRGHGEMGSHGCGCGHHH